MQMVRFWPPVPSIRHAANKWNTVAILDMIAAENGWMRPRTTPLHHGCIIPADTVLKRSHSDSGEHVILPEHSVVGNGTEDIQKRHALSALRTWEELEKVTFSTEEKWVSQEYVQTLASLGEWRCFLVGGHIECIVHTVPDTSGRWRGRRVSTFLSLEEIRYAICLHSSYATY